MKAGCSHQRMAGLMLVLTGSCLIGIGITIQSPGSWEVLWQIALCHLKGNVADISWFNQVNRIACEAAIRGFILLVTGIGMTLLWNRFTGFVPRRSIWLGGSMVLLMLLWLPIALKGHSLVIGDQRYWWLSDDAMISMRYARNLASGLGLVWNVGEWVEGFTNFLWIVYMAAVHWISIPVSKTSLVILITNLVIAAATIPVIARLVSVIGGGALAVAASIACFILSKNVMYWTSEGAETTLLTFLFLLSITDVLRDAKLQRVGITPYLFIGLTALVRADAIVPAGLVCALSLAINHNRARVLRNMLIALAPPTLYFLFRVSYYGDILPNTAYLKVVDWDGRYLAGLSYVLQFCVRYLFLLAIATSGFILCRQPERRLLFELLCLYIGYVAYVGGDAFQDFRFFVPVLPVLFILCFLTIQELPVSSDWRFTVSVIALVSIPLAISPSYLVYLSPEPVNVGFVRRGVLLKQNTASSTKIAATGIGSTFYYANRPGVDLLGKVDPHIARLKPCCPGVRAGHNRFDFNYSLGVLKPDLVICNLVFPVDETTVKRQADTSSIPADARLYLHPLFRKHCLPHPVLGDPERTIYACDWSPEVNRTDRWIPLPSDQ